MDGVARGYRWKALRQPLEDEGRIHRGHPGAADVVADIDAPDAERRRLAHDVNREELLLVPFDREWRDFFRGKIPRNVANRDLVLVESELHPAPFYDSRMINSENRYPSCARSIHRRDRKLRALLDAGRPARGHGLGLGVKADRIRAVLVEIAEAGLLPAAEGVIRNRHRDRHVDADHADIDLGGEVACRVTIAGEDRNAVAIVMIGWQRQRLLVIVGAHHREHRSENLFLVHAPVLGDAVDQAAAHVEAVFIALHLEAAAIDREFGAFLDADLDIILDSLQRRFGHQRTEISGWIGRQSDLQALDPRDQFFHQAPRGGLADPPRAPNPPPRLPA